MKYAIIEDEIHSIENLKQIMRKIRPGYQLAFEAQSVADGAEILAGNHGADLIFMDVELTDGNCFDIFKTVKVTTPIIFTTAYDEYALKAFKVNSIDYLLKPIGEKDVEDTLVKFESLRAESGQKQADISGLERMFANKNNQRLLIFKGDTISYIQVKDVAFFLSEGNYVYAHLNNGQHPITTFSNLGELTEMLDSTRFFQLSRNVITSVEAISKISKYFRGRLHVTLKYGNSTQEVIVSAGRRNEFLNWLGK